jgi:hypothetical protein
MGVGLAIGDGLGLGFGEGLAVGLGLGAGFFEPFTGGAPSAFPAAIRPAMARWCAAFRPRIENFIYTPTVRMKKLEVRLYSIVKVEIRKTVSAFTCVAEWEKTG